MAILFAVQNEEFCCVSSDTLKVVEENTTFDWNSTLDEWKPVEIVIDRPNVEVELWASNNNINVVNRTTAASPFYLAVDYVSKGLKLPTPQRGTVFTCQNK
jgi:hypothetical protein